MASPVIATVYGDIVASLGPEAGPGGPVPLAPGTTVVPSPVKASNTEAVLICGLGPVSGVPPEPVPPGMQPQTVSAATFPTIYKERPKGTIAAHARNFPVLATDQRIVYT